MSEVAGGALAVAMHTPMMVPPLDLLAELAVAVVFAAAAGLLIR